MATISAPGKIIMIGDHSVVYGEPAIIASVGLRCYITVEKSDNIIFRDGKTAEEFSVDEVLSFVEDADLLWKSGFEKSDFSELFEFMKSEKSNFRKMAVGKVLKALKIKSGAEIRIESDIPAGVGGVGASAAFAVALTKAVSDLYNKKSPLDEINRIAYEIEKIQHGNPSGGDNAACCYGGLIWFKRSSPSNTIQPLNIGYELENFVIVNSGNRERTTGKLVQHVRNLDDKYRSSRIKALGIAANKMRAALNNRDFESVKKLINLAQCNLAELGVSTKNIDRIAQVVVNAGGAAKLCGAGGGGTVLCFHEDKERLKQAIRNAGFEPRDVELGVEGVRTEKL
ncbi:MAG: mevalonate kinase [Candidatus Aenigmarchaeota archaeon]|nr:mevalonate kinase [Candidatus Aenigmarchaeota archaeon]